MGIERGKFEEHEFSFTYFFPSHAVSEISTPTSSETQGQSVGSGEKAGRKFSSKGERARGYRLSPNYFPKIQADAGSVLLCPIGEQSLLASCREFVHDERGSF